MLIGAIGTRRTISHIRQTYGHMDKQTNQAGWTKVSVKAASRLQVREVRTHIIGGRFPGVFLHYIHKSKVHIHLSATEGEAGPT